MDSSQCVQLAELDTDVVSVCGVCVSQFGGLWLKEPPADRLQFRLGVRAWLAVQTLLVALPL